MGDLHRRVPADPDPGRNPGQHRSLGGPDQGAAAGVKIVLFQIRHAHQPPAELPVGLDTLHIDEAVWKYIPHPLRQVLEHGVIDILNMPIYLRAFQFRLRQDQSQGGGRVADGTFHRLPVLRLGGKLIAGNHCPSGEIDALPGKQNISGRKGGFLKLFVHAVASNAYSASRMAFRSSGNSS